MYLTTISTSSEPVVSLADLKCHLRVDGDDDDSYIEGLRDAALEYIESETGHDFRTRTTDLTLDYWTVRCATNIELPRAPLQSVTSVSYYGSDNVLTVMPTTDYYVVKSSQINGYIQITTFPSVYDRPDAMTIRFVSGHTHPPALVKHAVKLLVGSWYELRQAEVLGTITTEVKVGLQRILDQLSTVMVA